MPLIRSALTGPIAAIAWLLTLTPAGAASVDGADPRVHELVVATSARERLREEFEQLSAKGRMSVGEATDFVTYLADFDRRIAEQCRELLADQPQLRSEVETMSLHCDVPPPPRASTIELPESELSADQIASLEAELTQGLGDFDEMLLKEQEKLASRQQRSSAGGGGGGRTGGEQGGDGEQGDASAQGNESGDRGERGQTPDQQRGERRGREQSDGSTGSPNPGAPREDGGHNPSGDDVVARQLREAAEKETDPELKKKLWEEYRRYKGDTQ